MGKPKQAQRYYIPERGIEVKVEAMSASQYCVHYPEGPERARYSEVRDSGWICKGPWQEAEQ
jgi:hypothetical protein